MGNISACCLPSKKEDPTSERARILDNPVDDTLSSDYSPQGDNYNSFNSNYGSVADSGLRQEQNQLNRTLHKMANQVIDVTSVDTSHVEQSEYMERQRIYQNKLPLLRTPHLRSTPTQNVRRKKAPDAVKFNFDPISEEDLNLINEFSEKSARAVKQGFVIKSDEDLVVQFNP